MRAAEQVELAHAARTTELETTKVHVKARIEYERVLVERQKAAEMVIYQPNHANDTAAKCDRTRLQDILELHEEERKANRVATSFVEDSLSTAKTNQEKLLAICGDNESVERYREWLTLHEDATWKLTPGREADRIFREAAAEKKSLLAMLSGSMRGSNLACLVRQCLGSHLSAARITQHQHVLGLDWADDGVQRPREVAQEPWPALRQESSADGRTGRDA